MNPRSYMVAKILIVFGLITTGTTVSAQTSDTLPNASQTEALRAIPPVTMDTKIRRELKSQVSSLKFEQGGVRIIRITKDTQFFRALRRNSTVQIENNPEKPLQAQEAGQANNQNEYAISCNPLSIPDSIDATYGLPANGQKTIFSETDSGITFKAYRKADANNLKKLDRIAQLSCVEAEIK